MSLSSILNQEASAINAALVSIHLSRYCNCFVACCSHSVSLAEVKKAVSPAEVQWCHPACILLLCIFTQLWIYNYGRDLLYSCYCNTRIWKQIILCIYSCATMYVKTGAGKWLLYHDVQFHPRFPELVVGCYGSQACFLSNILKLKTSTHFSKYQTTKGSQVFENCSRDRSWSQLFRKCHCY